MDMTQFLDISEQYEKNGGPYLAPDPKEVLREEIGRLPFVLPAPC
jgi:hypothetical protein